jgi:guanylate kinase
VVALPKFLVISGYSNAGKSTFWICSLQHMI